ncbi:MAG: SAM-dependent methyltransferase [Thermoprotei archaeon]|nr:MAG: SAM-dependent methyltransferase [Thermoprotei archaeon]
MSYWPIVVNILIPRYKPLVPYVPTNMEILDTIFSLAKFRKDDIFYDLGCGDGRVVIEAVKRHDIKKAVGIEIREELVKTARENVKKAGLEEKVEIIHGDFFNIPLTNATVVYMYLTRSVNKLLKPKLKKELRIGARIITLDFEIPGWRPVAVIKRNRIVQNTVYLYVKGVSDLYDDT